MIYCTLSNSHWHGLLGVFGVGVGSKKIWASLYTLRPCTSIGLVLLCASSFCESSGTPLNLTCSCRERLWKSRSVWHLTRIIEILVERLWFLGAYVKCMVLRKWLLEKKLPSACTKRIRVINTRWTICWPNLQKGYSSNLSPVADSISWIYPTYMLWLFQH